MAVILEEETKTMLCSKKYELYLQIEVQETWRGKVSYYVSFLLSHKSILYPTTPMIPPVVIPPVTFCNDSDVPWTLPVSVGVLVGILVGVCVTVTGGFVLILFVGVGMDSLGVGVLVDIIGFGVDIFVGAFVAVELCFLATVGKTMMGELLHSG